MPKLTNSFSSSLQFIILLLYLHRFVSGATGPWYLKDYALSQGLPTSTLMDVGGNSTHLYAIEPEWFIHFFKSNATSGVFEYRSYWDSWDFDGAYRGDWSDDRTEIDLKIAINPFNSLVYIAKYVIKPTNSPRLIILGYNSYDIASQISMYTYNDPQYFGTAYANPRLKMAFDNNSNVYVCQYNDPRRSAKAGFFIAKMSPQLIPIKNITSVNEGALSISFFCHQSPIICVWTTSQSVTEYWMSNFTVYRNRSLNQPPITIGFNPKIVETTNGDFTYYLHHNVNQNTTVVLHKKNATHDPVPNEAAQLPHTMQLPPPEVYDMVRATNGDIIVGIMTAPNPPVGLGDRDVAVFRYSSTLEMKSQFVFSTVLRDTISKLLLPNGDGNIIVVSGVTDGHPNLTLETSFVRRAFVVRFEYFEITEVSTRIQSYIQPAEIINITLTTLPTGATSSVPVVLIDQQPCQVVRWIGSSLVATIPSGAGGPFEISVQFNYLPHSPSVKAYNFTYVPIPSLLDIQPRFGPAGKYNVSEYSPTDVILIKLLNSWLSRCFKCG
ncbi:hypothetical protein BKA69DRAFT_1091467 [Paraphysoderma sedebokerense]|nr:hypothetical protein BKA69DRAFT_1091467 [Paraphysoderma sedebokerense]